MKPSVILSTLTFLFLSCSAIFAEEKGNIRLKTEWIKVPTEKLIQLTLIHKNDGEKIRADIQKLLQDNTAQVHEISVTSLSHSILSENEISLSNKSINQMIFPTEPDPEDKKFELPLHGPYGPLDNEADKETTEPEYYSFPRDPGGFLSTFEERPIGTMHYKRLKLSGKNLSIEFSSELTHFLRFDMLLPNKDRWGKTEIIFPIFTKQSTDTDTTIPLNSYHLLSFAPALDKDGKPSPTTSLVIFLKASTPKNK